MRLTRHHYLHTSLSLCLHCAPNPGDSPVLASIPLLKSARLACRARFKRMQAQIEADPEAVQQLGWMREMYAFSVAAAVERLPLQLAVRSCGLWV